MRNNHNRTLNLESFAKELDDLTSRAQRDRLPFDRVCYLLQSQITNVKMRRAISTPVA